MGGRFDLGIRRNRDRALTAGKALLVMGLLNGCSSVPDVVNPVAWYQGASDLVTGQDSAEADTATKAKAQPADAGKAGAAKAADTRKDLTKGLPADRGNSKYAEPLRREVTPTKPLVRRAPAAATQVAAAPEAAVVPPKPEVAKQDLPPAPEQAAPVQTAQDAAPRLSPDKRTATVRDGGPDAPPASMDMTPPAVADIPETVTVPARAKLKPIQEQFQRRLAESAQQTMRPNLVENSSSLNRYGEDEPIHLVPPSSRHNVKGGGKGMAAPAPLPAASFRVAAMDFAAGTAELTAADRQSIAEVVRVYKQTGGVIRVVGHAPALALGQGDAVQQVMGGFDASMKRANAVARELTKRGIPSRKIQVGADPESGDVGAQVFLDVL